MIGYYEEKLVPSLDGLYVVPNVLGVDHVLKVGLTFESEVDILLAIHSEDPKIIGKDKYLDVACHSCKFYQIKFCNTICFCVGHSLDLQQLADLHLGLLY